MILCQSENKEKLDQVASILNGIGNGYQYTVFRLCDSLYMLIGEPKE